jgi:Inositol polyphosphate kinase
MSLSKHDHRIQPMIGQVGGLGLNRKPILTLVPDYLLKPLVLDHRGLREIAFYEAIRTFISQSQPKEIQYNYNNFLNGRDQQLSPKSSLTPSPTTNNNVSPYMSLISSIRSKITSVLTPFMASIDTISMALALTYIKDPYVLKSEKMLHEAWQNIQYEVDMMRQLHKFTPPYYGVIVIATPQVDPALSKAPVSTTTVEQTRSETDIVSTIPPTISESTPVHTNVIMDSDNFWNKLEDAHLLLQDLTINYSKPCVMDLKMGVQTYVRSYCLHDID